MSDTKVDISRIPFSRYGAYISVTEEPETAELIIHNVMRACGQGEMLSLRFGESIVCSARPERVIVKTATGKARLYIRDDRTLVVESIGLPVILQMKAYNSYGVQNSENQYRMVSVDQHSYVTFGVKRGHGTLDDASGCAKNRHNRLTVTCVDGRSLLTVRISHMEPAVLPDSVCPKADIAAIREEWDDFLRLMPNMAYEDEVAREFTESTWYNLWSGFVRAEDVYHSDVMLMSKKCMTSVWSWDHCFNALALANVDQAKALAQFEAPFLLQSPNGALPDYWNPHQEVIWGVTKPPIHGWCFGKLMDRFDFDAPTLQRVYGYLTKWTNWWLTYNDSDHDGIPEYPQGCDSGWDNATLFDTGYYLETPDLPAYLILQLYAQARIAKVLSQADASWQTRATHDEQQAEELRRRWYAHSWNGRGFVTHSVHEHDTVIESTCLLSLMPLVLGEQLENDKRDTLAAQLERDFLTDHGLATEMPASAKYAADGYWRGPIWAPVTYLLVDGLRRGGYEALAATIAHRYCHMSSHIAKGNYENFNALTGEGLRARGYTWSASVYMLLKQEYQP